MVFEVSQLCYVTVNRSETVHFVFTVFFRKNSFDTALKVFVVGCMIFLMQLAY